MLGQLVEAAQRGESVVAGMAPEKSREEMHGEVLDALGALQTSLAAAAFVAPLEVQAKIHAFSGSIAEDLTRSAIEGVEGQPAPGPDRTPEDRMAALQLEADELLAALRGDLVGHADEQVAAEVSQLAEVRASNTGRISQLARDAKDRMVARSELNDRRAAGPD